MMSAMTALMTGAPPTRTTDQTKPSDNLCLNLLLHICAPGRHAEFLSAHFGQHGDALADLFMGGARKTQPQTAAGMGGGGGVSTIGAGGAIPTEKEKFAAPAG